MRLPTLENGKIDEEHTRKMVKLALENGVNYFDTAYPYHNGESELVIGKLLKEYPRESFRLATKYPGHQILDEYDPKGVFEHQLEKCGVEYFDYYLLHNVSEHSIKTYMDPKWGILDYFREQKRLGRIRHLGFSSHGSLENLTEFLDYCDNEMDFCQIQLNYLDWTLQSAKEKYELLTERGIPVWVMEPVRGGKLANLPEKASALLKQFRPDETDASWCFRFLQSLPNVALVLSGMSNLEQLTENINTFSERKILNETELDALFGVAEGLKNSVPCTGCGYCKEGCPMGLNIPDLLSLYNDFNYAPSSNIAARIESLPDDKQPSSCIGCNACSEICPQKINIPSCLAKFSEELSKIPSWAEVCRKRAEAAAKIKNK
jgi:predicted aldo/keto reductase-like oxidoreductase